MRGTGGGEGQLARESRRNESERRGTERESAGHEERRGIVSRANMLHERVTSESEGGKGRERTHSRRFREFKTDMLISLGIRCGDSQTPSFPLKRRSLASIARL